MRCGQKAVGALYLKKQERSFGLKINEVREVEAAFAVSELAEL